MSVEELDDNERQSFLIWRRSLARLLQFEMFLFFFDLSGYSTLKSVKIIFVNCSQVFLFIDGIFM